MISLGWALPLSACVAEHEKYLFICSRLYKGSGLIPGRSTLNPNHHENPEKSGLTTSDSIIHVEIRTAAVFMCSFSLDGFSNLQGGQRQRDAGSAKQGNKHGEL